jgi:hypothetical protein
MRQSWRNRRREGAPRQRRVAKTTVQGSRQLIPKGVVDEVSDSSISGLVSGRLSQTKDPRHHTEHGFAQESKERIVLEKSLSS